MLPHLIDLNSPFHPVLRGAEGLVQPVRQSLPEVLLEVSQLKNSSKTTVKWSFGCGAVYTQPALRIL